MAVKARKRLFHVEDSAELRELIGHELAMVPGIELVGSADRADDAIKQIRHIEPDLVVLDLQLLEGSGIEVLRRLKGSATPPQVVILTNHSDARFRELSLRAGAQHFFDKSTQLEEFFEFVKTVGH